MDSQVSNKFHPIASMMVRIGISLCFCSIILGAPGPGVKADFAARTAKRVGSTRIQLDTLLYLPLIASGSQPIFNGDFELGPDQNGNPIGWTASSGGQEGLAHSLVDSPPTIGGQIDPYIPLGKYSMLLGSTGYPCNPVPIGFAAVEQTVRVPNVADDLPLNLVFTYIFYTQDLSTLDPPDRFEVHIKDPIDHVEYTDKNLTNQASCDGFTRIPPLPPSPDAWKIGTVDLKFPIDFRGKTVTISFQNWNSPDNFYNTLTFLDSVLIQTGP